MRPSVGSAFDEVVAVRDGALGSELPTRPFERGAGDSALVPVANDYQDVDVGLGGQVHDRGAAELPRPTYLGVNWKV